MPADKLIKAPPGAAVARCARCQHPVIWGRHRNGDLVMIDADQKYRPIESATGDLIAVDDLPLKPPAQPVPVLSSPPPVQTETLFGDPDTRDRWSTHRCVTS